MGGRQLRVLWGVIILNNGENFCYFSVTIHHRLNHSKFAMNGSISYLYFSIVKFFDTMHYQDINAIFTKANGDVSAAESHGMATGILCINGRAEIEFWLREIQQDGDEFNADDQIALENLFEDTRGLLVSDEFTFEPLLPDESASFDEQVEALRRWSQGFLYGLGTTSALTDWPIEAQEVLKDIAEFTKLESNAEDEESENDLMELTEYLRAAVIFLQSELNLADNRNDH
jgi:uncharacterized protein